MDLDSFAVPRKRRPPRRYSGPAEPYQADNAMEYYKLEYYKVIDTVALQLDNRLSKKACWCTSNWRNVFFWEKSPMPVESILKSVSQHCRLSFPCFDSSLSTRQLRKLRECCVQLSLRCDYYLTRWKRC